MPDEISASVFTALFQMDIRKFTGNPFHADTPFGRATATCAGDLFETNRILELRVRALEEELEARTSRHAVASQNT